MNFWYLSRSIPSLKTNKTDERCYLFDNDRKVTFVTFLSIAGLILDIMLWNQSWILKNDTYHLFAKFEVINLICYKIIHFFIIFVSSCENDTKNRLCIKNRMLTPEFFKLQPQQNHRSTASPQKIFIPL